MSSFTPFFYKLIGEQVRKFRIEKGLTQEQFSAILNLNDKYIGHIERAERQISTRVLGKVLDYMQLQPQDFFKTDKRYDWNNKTD